METHEYKIFIAEDESLLVRDLIKKITNWRLGLKVVGHAPTGLMAYNQILEYKPDIVITDIRMPVWDGLRLLGEIRQKFPHIKCIVLSGYSDFAYAQEALKLQVFDYLLKPVSDHELKCVLQKMKNALDLTSESSFHIFHDINPLESPKHTAWLLKEYIIQHYTEAINLNLLADSMKCSPALLTKLFIQNYNISPGKYITSLRLGFAKNLLQNRPDLSIKEIALLCGYSEQGYFSRIFRKYTGQTPVEYREGYKI